MVNRTQQDRIDEANKTGKYAPTAEEIARSRQGRDPNNAQPLGTGPQPDTPTAKYHAPIPPVGAPGTSGTPVPPLSPGAEEQRRIDEQKRNDTLRAQEDLDKEAEKNRNR